MTIVDVTRHREAAATTTREIRSSNLSDEVIVATLGTRTHETREAEGLLLEETRKPLEDQLGETRGVLAVPGAAALMLARSQVPSVQVAASAPLARVQTVLGVQSSLAAGEGTKKANELGCRHSVKQQQTTNIKCLC